MNRDSLSDHSECPAWTVLADGATTWFEMCTAQQVRAVDAEKEIERLTERYDAVRHAYGVEAQERGRLEQRLRGAVEALRKIDALLDADMDRGAFMVRLEQITADALATYGGESHV